MTIISASRRTDIPAFYAEWFMRRVRSGHFYRVNPFNTRQVTGFSLDPGDVDAFIFWTKDPHPLLRHLAELDNRGYNYYFQFTLNPYDTPFEPNTPPLTERIVTFRKLAEFIGPQRVVWRYDPIILSSITPVEYHLQMAGRIASALAGSTESLVFSFLDFYGKVQGRLKKLQERSGITLADIAAPQLRDERERLAAGLKSIADRHGLKLLSCSEEVDLAAFGIEHGSCIDGNLIRELTGSSKPFARDRNQRGACGCVESVDMGIYSTCSFNCAYCYANSHGATIESNRKRHHPESASLLYDYEGDVEIRRGSGMKKPGVECGGRQPDLFATFQEKTPEQNASLRRQRRSP